MIVDEIVRREALNHYQHTARRRLLSVGSILHFAQDGDVVWGSGVNGKFADQVLGVSDLDVRAVRGPKTRKYLLDHGVQAPAVYGDPGLLTSILWPALKNASAQAPVTAVMNFHDNAPEIPGVQNISPRDPIATCLSRIASSSLVVGSSLHGIIVAESFGIPARLVRSQHEPSFKYDDYYAGTGRENYRAADSIQEAMELGGEPGPVWSADDLLDAFPRDLWESEPSH